MENKHFAPALDAVDVRHLYYFSVVAQENSLHKAAERLFMAQPPLSRQIQQLEERLGVSLFVRHSKGLTLTAQGARVLEIIQPLLQAKEEVFARLREELHPEENTLRVGLSTAFEQGVFAKLEARLQAQYEKRLHVFRASSVKLAKDVLRGKLDAAFVALPLEAPGLAVLELAYKEPLMAVLPALWLEAATTDRVDNPTLRSFSGRPLFWFKREANPAFFDFCKGYFALVGFTPKFIGEPAEHDVFLARIASGEGMGLFAASFSNIRRDGVVFVPLTGEVLLGLQLGLVTLPSKNALSENLKNEFMLLEK